MHKLRFSKPSSASESSSTVPQNAIDNPISERQTTLPDRVEPTILDGADPTSSPYNEFEFIHTDSANEHQSGDSNNTATEPEPPLPFNPVRYNLPTRLYNPSTSTASPKSTASTDRVFLVPDPTPLQIRIFLDDIEQAGKDHGMSGSETIGMALYYADRDSALLWKWMVESAKGRDWARFKNHVLWFYPDAIFAQEAVERVFARVQSALSDEELPRVVVAAYDVTPCGVREHIVGCLRILEDFSTRMGSSTRQLCMGFAEGLPPRKMRGGHNSDVWKENLGKRVRERYPDLMDEFDCNPRRFLYYAFLVWREAWVSAENKYFRDSGF